MNLSGNLRTSLVLLFLYSFGFLSAEKLEGYYIDVRGDTVFCTFSIPMSTKGINYLQIAEVVTIVNEKGKKQRIKAGEIRSFIIQTDSSEENLVSVKLYDEYLFLKEIEDGWAKLYTQHFSSDDGNATFAQYVLAFPFRQAFVLRPKRFRKQLLKLTNNDPFFAAKFAGSAKYEDLPRVISRYNELKNN